MQNLSAIHKVFVYGTLKSGEPNHHWITDAKNGKGTFQSRGRTILKYPLIIGTRYNIPFLLYKPGCGHNVMGEIYEVDERMLEKLDELEDHPDFYERQLEDISTDSNVETSQLPSRCWVYFLKKYKPELLNLHMLETYHSNGDHGLQYCERYCRDPNISPKEEVYLN